MTGRFHLSLLPAVLAIGLLAGCEQKKAGEPPAPSPKVSADQSAAETGDGTAKAGSTGDEYAAALAELSPEDRALAEMQKTCPVSGEPLGSMGKPYKVTVEGKDVLLCCQGCEGEIKKDPQKYLAKAGQRGTN